MSGNPTGSNVVPMPHAQAPAPAGAQPQMPVPFPMWGGGGSLPWGPGCCPPGGMDALMKCYCDVQAATAFICSVMVTCIQNNPAVTAAIIAAIEKSGSNLPLIGVTNGSDAQPGQVGEFVTFSVFAPYPTSELQQTIVAGVLQPGDWNVWAWTAYSTYVTGALMNLNPQPPGFFDTMTAQIYAGSGTDEQGLVVVAPMTQASLSVPTLVSFGVLTNANGAGVAAGNVYLYVRARRMR